MSSTIDRQPVGDVSWAYVLAVNRRTPRFSRSVGRQHAEPLGRSVGQGAAVGTAAELPQTTSCTGSGAGLATSSPRTKARTRAPTACPRSRRGWATVVSGGSAEWAGRRVVEPHYGQSVRDRDAGIMGGAQGAQGELVAEGEDGGRAQVPVMECATNDPDA